MTRRRAASKTTVCAGESYADVVSLTPAQLDVLRAVVRAGWYRNANLATELRKREASISFVMTNLYQMGLVQYRGTGFEPTDKGRAAIKAVT